MNETQLFYDSYLAHHGIKGMKQGVRSFQNKDMSLTPAARKRYADDNSVKRVVRGHAGPDIYTTKKRQLEGDKRDLEGLNKGQYLSVGLTKKRQAALDARDKAALEKRIAKNEAKAQKAAQTKTAVKDYNKKFNAASKASDEADAKWEKVQQEYKSLGKNKISRMINAARGKSDAAKSYNKNYDDWSASQDAADALWSEAKSAYVKTGRTRVTRIINNIKCDKKVR